MGFSTASLYATEMKDIELFLEALRSYASGKSNLASVEATFKNLDMFHDFGHYLSDSDIRDKDAVYAEMQNRELERFISALEENDYDLAQSITFLGGGGV